METEIPPFQRHMQYQDAAAPSLAEVSGAPATEKDTYMPKKSKTPRTDQERHLTIDDLCKRLSISRTTLHRMRVSGNIPKPRQVNERNPRWKLSVIEDWEDGLKMCFITQLPFEISYPKRPET